MAELFPDSFDCEFVRFICGDLIAAGSMRRVYEFKPDPTYVIKVDHSGVRFANVDEWGVWSEAVERGVQDWFAPIKGISDSGHFLVMEKTEPIKRLPKRLPNFFADIKLSNFGRLPNGKIVAHDYANHRLFRRGFSGWSLKKVSKRDHERE